ncbi:MAG: acyltransferase family protein [Candidatus Coprovivens sp.]
MEKKRVNYIDIAKGISIICIILGHLGIKSIDKVVFTFHVPIFFIISGYFLNDKINNREFIKSKFNRLIIPYFFICLVIIILGSTIGIMKGEFLSSLIKWCYASFYGSGITYNEPFYIPQIGALWFLLALFWSSIFLKKILDYNKDVRFLIVAFIFLFGYFSKKIFWFPFSIQAGACATLFMYIGYLLKQSSEIIDKISEETKIFIIIFCFLTWFYFIKNFLSFEFSTCDFGRGIFDIIGSLCACVCIITLSKFIEYSTNYLSKILCFFGKNSLLVLFVHIVELNLFQWEGVIGNVPLAYQAYVILVLKLVFILTCVYILSKIKIIKKIFAIK